MFDNDQFSGKGCLKLKHGKKGKFYFLFLYFKGIYEGFFEENFKHGKGVLRDEKGNMFEGTFVRVLIISSKIILGKKRFWKRNI